MSSNIKLLNSCVNLGFYFLLQVNINFQCLQSCEIAIMFCCDPGKGRLSLAGVNEQINYFQQI